MKIPVFQLSQSTLRAEQRDQMISKETFAEKAAELIRGNSWSEVEIRMLYEAIISKMRSKMCFKCAKLKPEMGGALTFPDGDMSKPKRFVCGDCK